MEVKIPLSFITTFTMEIMDFITTIIIYICKKKYIDNNNNKIIQKLKIND